jgi:hypothetical protein
MRPMGAVARATLEMRRAPGPLRKPRAAANVRVIRNEMLRKRDIGVFSTLAGLGWRRSSSGICFSAIGGLRKIVRGDRHEAALFH